MKKYLFSLSSVLFPLCLQAIEMPSLDGCFHVNAEWLYWKAQEDNLFVGSFVDSTPALVQSKEIEPDFKFTNGFRVCAEYQSHCSPWKYSLKFTHLPFRDNPTLYVSQFALEEHQQFIAINSISFPIFSGFPLASSFLVDWNGCLSFADIDFARDIIALEDSLLVTAHFGFRALWMRQKLYTEGLLTAPFINNATFFKTTMKEHVQAYGLEAGLWGSYPLWYNFSLFGHVGASLLYSNFHSTLKNRGYLEDGSFVFSVNGGGREDSTTPSTDFLIGLQYSYAFEKIVISFHAAWEQHVFFDCNHLSITGGNFSVQGLTLGAAVAF